MSWFSKSPFGRDEDPVEHMLTLLNNEAAKSGVPLSHEDLEALRSEQSPIPEDLRERVKNLIAKIFHTESDPFEEDPKSFSNSIQWADPHYPHIVALAEEVACEIGAEAYPPLRGWARVKDRAQLLGCGCLAVLLMFAAVVIAGWIFHWK